MFRFRYRLFIIWLVLLLFVILIKPVSELFTSGDTGHGIIMTVALSIMIYPVIRLAYKAAKNKYAVIVSKDKLILNCLNLTVSYEDIIYCKKISFLHGNICVVIKLDNFETYKKMLSKTLWGKFILLRFRMLGKSVILLNTNIIMANYRELADSINTYVHKSDN